MTRLDDAAHALRRLANALDGVLVRHPNATVVRSRVGNLSILDDHQRYIGWADILIGEVVLIAGEAPGPGAAG